MLQLFHDICVAVAYLHSYKRPGVTRKTYSANDHPMEDENNHRQDQALLSGQQFQHESSRIETHKPGMEDEIVPWAHRDIKPG